MHSAWLTPPYVFLWVPQLCALAFLALIVRFDRRSLWSGFALFVFIMTVGVTAACLYVDTMDLVPSPWIRTLMLWIGLLAAAVIVAFPVLLGVFLTAEGCRLLRREGVSPANCLSLAAGLFVLLDLTLIPYLASLVRNAVVTWLFALASACVLFFSAQLAIYCLSVFVNLVHVGKPRDSSRSWCWARASSGQLCRRCWATAFAKASSCSMTPRTPCSFCPAAKGPAKTSPKGAR